MTDSRIYRVAFLKHGKVYEMYCRNVSSTSMWGFLELETLIFGKQDALVVDPTEEKMRSEFEGVEVLYLPLHSVLSVERVEKRGKAVIRDRESGEKVTPFPLSPPGKSAS